MRVTWAKLLRLKIPLKRSFGHARAVRHESDCIVVRLRDADGREGLGEILPRSYVTGETVESVMFKAGPAALEQVLARHFTSEADIDQFVRNVFQREEWGPALLAGIESALIELALRTTGFDVERALGPRRTRPTGKCYTLGLESPDDDLRRRALEVRVSGATVVKVKVADVSHADRVNEISEHLRGRVPIRLDANGAFDVDAAAALLAACRDAPIESIEEPIAWGGDFDRRLLELRALTSVPLLADESVSRLSDLRRCIRVGAFHGVNVRVGKCGGMLGARQILQDALAGGLFAVGGTMVGETGILNRGSGALLAHSDELDYMEGLGQNGTNLAEDIVALEEEHPRWAAFPLLQIQEGSVAAFGVDSYEVGHGRNCTSDI